MIGFFLEILYRASPNQNEAMVIEIDPSIAREKNITPMNHLFNDRRFQMISPPPDTG